jgi:hypothetical protein
VSNQGADELEILTVVGADGSDERVVVLALVEDEQGAMAVTCPEAALSGDVDAPLALRVFRWKARKRRLELADEPNPERVAWAIAVAEEALLDG